jgi:hypothetical protein
VSSSLCEKKLGNFRGYPTMPVPPDNPLDASISQLRDASTAGE